MIEELKRTEAELNDVCSGLEELFITDAWLPLLTMGVWTDRAVRARDAMCDMDHEIRMNLFLSLQTPLTSITNTLKRFQNTNDAWIRREEENTVSAYGPAMHGLLAGLDLLNANLAILRPPPRAPKDRRIRFTQLLQQNTRTVHVPMMAAALGVYQPLKTSKIVDDMLWFAVNILKARRLKLVDHICPLLARVFPLMYPPIFFPGEKNRIPSTALAVQKRYSRLP